MKDDVVLRAAWVPGEQETSKSYVAWLMMTSAINQGLVKPDTTVIVASSGNTGKDVAQLCKAIGVKCRVILPGGTVQGKIDVIRIIGAGVEVITHNDPDETPVARARREGKLSGFWDSDQYKNPNNPLAHKTYLAPQLFRAAGQVALIGVASGTMGTAMGLKQYVIENGLLTEILPIVLTESHEVPGARPLSKILKDVEQPWEGLFDRGDLEFGTRHPSFLLAYYSWQCVPKALGPSFGLAYQGVLRRLYKEKQAGTLDRLRGPDGTIQVLIFGADSYHLYLNLIMGETRDEERVSRVRPDLLALAL